MTLAAAVAAAVVFALVARLCRGPLLLRRAVGRGQQAIADLRDAQLEPRARERAIQGHALALLALGGGLAAVTAVAVAVPGLLLWGAAAVGWVDWDAVVATASAPWFLVALLAAGLGLRLAAGRRRSEP